MRYRVRHFSSDHNGSLRLQKDRSAERYNVYSVSRAIESHFKTSMKNGNGTHKYTWEFVVDLHNEMSQNMHPNHIALMGTNSTRPYLSNLTINVGILRLLLLSLLYDVTSVDTYLLCFKISFLCRASARNIHSRVAMYSAYSFA